MISDANRSDLPNPFQSAQPAVAALGHYGALAGFVLYAMFAPHSVAAADISMAIATIGWLVRTIANGRTGVRHTEFDVPLVLFLLWTAASSFLSVEPAISIAKLQASWAPLAFYVTQAVVTRRTAVLLACVLILSGVSGSLYSVYDLIRGRGVVVESLSGDSPFRSIDVHEGDTIWRVAGHRIYSTGEIDEIVKGLEPGKPVTISLITSGEQVERPGFVVSSEVRNRLSPSGVFGSHSLHLFRASGWTRHYETFSEMLQVVAQLALGLALANLRNHGFNIRFRIAIVASTLLATGIALTAMRTVLFAFAIGACFLVWQTLRGRARLVLSGAIATILVVGAVVVWQTRAQNALSFHDPSSTLRVQVARVGVRRIMDHPIFGHGMDAMHKHWNEWGFPGKDMLHLHSTPLQIAFDRGLPALGFWLWIVGLFWFRAYHSAQAAKDSSDTNRYGLLLGILGAATGFFVSSLVNYNFGDAEVALLFWWLLGVLVECSSPRVKEVCLVSKSPIQG
ncbi:MAG TPA: O-antigen ligase family protein [Pyrinomonadaceae bacterium]